MNELDQLPLPLLQWYHENARVLPWRSDPTPYHVWVSEIMLQQTRVAAVLGYYARFMEALPAVADLAAVEEDRLMKLWQGLGYYNRARNLQKAARQIVEEHGGVFPDTYEAIRALAGVGDYTAGAVASIAFGLPEPAVDGNVLRVVSRLTGDGGDITRPDVKKRMGAALREVIPLDAPGDFNQALMDLGAMVCLPNGEPLCARRNCPSRRRKGPAGWRSGRCSWFFTKKKWPCAGGRRRACWRACGSTPTSSPPPPAPWRRRGWPTGRPASTSSPTSSGAWPPAWWRPRRTGSPAAGCGRIGTRWSANTRYPTPFRRFKRRWRPGWAPRKQEDEDMAKLYFRYGVMGSSKTANALMVRYNYEERGQDALLVKPAVDQRDGARFVASRAGLSHDCIVGSHLAFFNNLLVAVVLKLFHTVVLILIFRCLNGGSCRAPSSCAGWPQRPLSGQRLSDWRCR